MDVVETGLPLNTCNNDQLVSTYVTNIQHPDVLRLTLAVPYPSYWCQPLSRPLRATTGTWPIIDLVMAGVMELIVYSQSVAALAVHERKVDDRQSQQHQRLPAVIQQGRPPSSVRNRPLQSAGSFRR